MSFSDRLASFVLDIFGIEPDTEKWQIAKLIGTVERDKRKLFSELRKKHPDEVESIEALTRIILIMGSMRENILRYKGAYPRILREKQRILGELLTELKKDHIDFNFLDRMDRAMMSEFMFSGTVIEFIDDLRSERVELGKSLESLLNKAYE